MAVRNIITYGNPVLRMKARRIERIDGSIRKLVDDMIDTMQSADGIGLAAPQVAQSIALCIVNMHMITEGEPPKAFLNPEIVAEEGTHIMEEGCLSIPDIREEVTRAETIKIKYRDLDGVEHEEICSQMLARVLQHEVDHINGVLFIDRITPIRRKLLGKKLRAIAAESRSGADVESR
ncbi:MAG TPA: peptide deformylase [bacterium]